MVHADEDERSGSVALEERSEFVDLPGLLPDAVVSAVGYRETGASPALHRGLPSPSLTLVFSLDDPIVTGTSPDHVRGPHAFRHLVILAGLQTAPAYIRRPETQSGIQVSIRPLAARALLGVPAGELRRLATEGSDVLGPSADRLRERLAELDTWAERAAVLARYLRERYARARMRQPRPEVVEAWRWIARHRGTGTMTDLARHVLLSPRQLRTLFHQEVGLGPKAVSRLMRFEHARQRIVAAVRVGEHPNLAEVAHTCGYSDHPHLVADFRQFVGASPTRWLAEERRFLQAGPVQPREDLGL